MARLLAITVLALTWLLLHQTNVFGTPGRCTSPFQVASNDPMACFLPVPTNIEDGEFFCESFEADPDIFRATPIVYDLDMSICYYYLIAMQNPGAPPEGCCGGGGLPGR